MAQFNIAEATAHFSKLVQQALMGEEIVTAKDNEPLLKMIPIHSPQQSRKPGSDKGQILWESPDFDKTPEDFDDYA
ncbi:MAG: type II toxin-antitoxin system Phd/YefM family antitoxin [Leptospirales bacterium]